MSGWLELLFGAGFVQILPALTLRLGFFGFSCSLPVFRTSLLYDGLGSIKGVDGYPLGATSATDLAKPCGGSSVTVGMDFPQLLRSPVFSEVHT